MISYDANVFIYFIEQNDEYATEAQRIISYGENQGAVLSSLLRQEVLTGCALYSPDKITIVKQALDSLKNTRFIEADNSLCDKAAELTEIYGKKVIGYDAVHIATALKNRATEFWTNDQTLLKLGKIDKLKIMPLINP